MRANVKNMEQQYSLMIPTWFKFDWLQQEEVGGTGRGIDYRRERKGEKHSIFLCQISSQLIRVFCTKLSSYYLTFFKILCRMLTLMYVARIICITYLVRGFIIDSLNFKLLDIFKPLLVMIYLRNLLLHFLLLKPLKEERWKQIKVFA